jgi:cell division protein FtsA
VKSGTFAAIDVGTTKICTIVGEVSGTGETRIIGVGVAPSAGLSRGMVDNIREATEAIRASVDKAERASGTRILSAFVGLSGAHVESINNRGIVAVPDRSRPISQDDVWSALRFTKSDCVGVSNSNSSNGIRMKNGVGRKVVEAANLN